MTADFSISQNKKEFRLFVTRAYSKLIKLKYRGYRESFNQVLLSITPKIKVYVNNYINVAIKKGQLCKDHYNIDDFMSAFFIEIYDRIDEVENEEDFYAWLYETADGLFPKMSLKEDFNDDFFNTIGDFSKQEWEEMQEKYNVTDDLLMTAELYEASYSHYSYILDHVFKENKEKDLREKRPITLKEEAVKNHMVMVLSNLPTAMRNIFELYTTEYLEFDEIAKINNITSQEVNILLNQAKKALQVSAYNRYGD